MLKSKRVFVIVTVILIQAFLLLDVAWASNGKLYRKTNLSYLSAPIHINNTMFFNNFAKFHAFKTNEFLKREEITLPETRQTIQTKSAINKILILSLIPFLQSCGLSYESVVNLTNKYERFLSNHDYTSVFLMLGILGTYLFGLGVVVLISKAYSKNSHKYTAGDIFAVIMGFSVLTAPMILGLPFLLIIQFLPYAIILSMPILLALLLRGIKKSARQKLVKRKEKKIKNRIATFPEKYPWAMSLISTMELGGIPTDTMITDGVPAAEKSIIRYFKSNEDKEKAKGLTISIGIELSELKIGACSTIQHGIPLIAKFSNGDIEIFAQCCEFLKKRVIVLHNRRINPLETLVELKKYKKALNSIKRTPQNLHDLLVIADISVGINKLLQAKGYNNLYFPVLGDNLDLSRSIARLEHTLIINNKNKRKEITRQKKQAIFKTITTNRIIGYEEIQVDNPGEADYGKGCPYYQLWYKRGSAIYAKENKKTGYKFETIQKRKEFILFFNSLSEEHIKTQLVKFGKLMHDIKLDDNANFAIKYLSRYHKVNLSKITKHSANINRTSLFSKENWNKIEQAI